MSALLFVWFWLVAGMITAYVVLDGFDLGVGVLDFFLARTEDEHRQLVSSIGPVWDGNEVWLIAGAGTLYFAFPRLYASAFSGFYLPLMIVLWLLVLRGVGLELRNHVESPVWRGLFGGAFRIGSLLLCIFFGAALGNVIRGVPLQSDGYFFLPLWTNWRVGPSPGVLDWYTVLSGAVALVALGVHGAAWVVLKTTGDINARARRVVRLSWPALLVLTIASLAATMWIRPHVQDNYRALPVLYAIPLAVVAALVFMRVWSGRGRERAAFLASCAYLALMLVGAAAAMYPALLASSTDPRLDITVAGAHSGAHALAFGLVWWSLGVAIAVGYFVLVYRMFRGKVALGGEGHGY